MAKNKKADGVSKALITYEDFIGFIKGKSIDYSTYERCKTYVVNVSSSKITIPADEVWIIKDKNLEDCNIKLLHHAKLFVIESSLTDVDVEGELASCVYLISSDAEKTRFYGDSYYALKLFIFKSILRGCKTTYCEIKKNILTSIIRNCTFKRSMFNSIYDTVLASNKFYECNLDYTKINSGCTITNNYMVACADDDLQISARVYKFEYYSTQYSKQSLTYEHYKLVLGTIIKLKEGYECTKFEIEHLHSFLEQTELESLNKADALSISNELRKLEQRGILDSRRLKQANVFSRLGWRRKDWLKYV